MPQHEVQIQETLKAPREKVFEFLADHEKFATLFGGSCRRIQDGQDEPNGLGSVRRMGGGPAAFEETITVFERPARIEYRVSRGGPIKNHLGVIQLRSLPGGTQLDYVIRFDGKLPGIGAIVAWALRAMWSRNAQAKLARLA